jgi:hypothetical protein
MDHSGVSFLLDQSKGNAGFERELFFFFSVFFSVFGKERALRDAGTACAW